MQPFLATNPLEQTLVDAQLRKIPATAMFEVLTHAQVFALLNQPLGDNGEWQEGTELLVLKNDENLPVIAVFSSALRAEGWKEIATGYDVGATIDFRWLLGGVVPDVGIVLNPGSEVGLELSPTMIKRLQDHTQDRSPETGH